MNRFLRLIGVPIIATAMFALPVSLLGQQAPPAQNAADSAPAAAKAQATIDKALAYLKAQQKPDGGWQDQKDPPAITALVVKTFVQDPAYGNQAELVKKGYGKLLSYQVANGGIYKDILANYNTSIAISSLAAANDPQYKPAIDKAVAYVKDLQWTQQTAPTTKPAMDEKNPWYGGFGYNGQTRTRGRPDMSNTQVALDALHDSGLQPSDPAFQASLKFISRMQNSSETNDQPWAGNDGGFIYSPGTNNAGQSMAGEYVGADGRRMLRSYGSMTYAGLKSFIYAGLSKDDPRVKAAWDWITHNWTLDENPGLRLGNPADAPKGLYYYYHTLARALRVYGQPVITDPQGKQHDWRMELIDKLASVQRPDGSWVNEDDKWMEGNPVLVTSYSILALQEAQADLKEHPAGK